MTVAAFIAIAFATLTVAIHIGSVAIAAVRCRALRGHVRARADAPPISLVRPVCGLDYLAEVTLGSSFRLDYADYEIIFCVAHARDPAIPLIERLIAAHPHRRASLLVGDDRISENPKLNNCVKGWQRAAHDWVVLADSNVLMPRDYLTRLMTCWTGTTGLVCSPPVGTHAEGFWASVECAILNGYQARWQYTADTAGVGFAQGKTMLWQREILERAGGIRQLGNELAEDAAATKIIRAQSLRVRLADAPFVQPLGHRTVSEVWRRQSRWAQLRRASFPMAYAPELLSTPIWAWGAAAFASHNLELPMLPVFTAMACVWYGAEMALAWCARWPVSIAYPLHATTRDLMLPALWVSGWVGSRFEWRGNSMRSVTPHEAV